MSIHIAPLSAPRSIARPEHGLMRWLGMTLLTCLLCSPAAAAAQSTWVWPVSGPTIIRGFDPPATPWSAGHRGVDLAATPGSTVHAIGPGVISFAGLVGGKPVVVVRHGALRSTYEPVMTRRSPGEVVSAGDAIGVLAAGHCPAGCLHLGLRRGENYLDPRAVLSSARLLSGSPARG
jgi:murein DD-endopeptidase MepM/ murein hydrolase activator NlpD